MFVFGATVPQWARASTFTRFLDHIHGRITVGGTRVISSSQRPLPDNTQHSQQTNINAPVGFEATISAGERPQTYALDRKATVIDNDAYVHFVILIASGLHHYKPCNMFTFVKTVDRSL